MPEHNQWDEPEWDFDFVPDGPPEALVGSDGDLPLTDGEDDLRFLIDGELVAESEDDLLSWGSFTPSDEEEEEEDEEDDASSNEEEGEGDTSSDEPPAKRFRGWAWSDDDEDDDDEEDEAPIEGNDSSDEELASSSTGGGYSGDDEDIDGP